ncbi:MAG: hypothetical protein OFPII_43240 [Osedax symbiont Rs1]|nr:MAG: hypothetical protein OFPII_43240 [Osedax symbiont Rs1]
MQYHLERQICFSEESKHKNLYPWSLQEVDEDGKMLGSKQIPWVWGLYFTASDLQYVRSISTEPLENKETITSILHSGICRDGKNLRHHDVATAFWTIF